MIIEVSEEVRLTLEQIKWLERVTKKGNGHNLLDCCCRKQRKRLKSNSGGSSKCNKTIDMFDVEDTEDE